VVKSLLYAGITFGGHENLGLLVLTPFAVLLAAFLSWPSVTRVLYNGGATRSAGSSRSGGTAAFRLRGRAFPRGEGPHEGA
jgi:hypothetical protein